MSQVAYGKVEERLLFLLSNLANKEHSREGYHPIDVSITHQDLAGMIGSTRETVTLLMSKLTNKKLVKIEKDRIWYFLGM